MELSRGALFRSMRRQLGAASNTARVVVAALSLSAAGFIGLVAHEGYTDQAVIPTQGDRPTLGFGSTFHEDGRPVRMGETTTPARALVIAKAHIGKDEAAFRASLAGASLHQAEFDLYLDWVYQYGIDAWTSSSMRREILAGNYPAACEALLAYRKLTSGRNEGPGWTVSKRNDQGRPVRWEFDCSTPGNRVCRGVWTRQLERHQKCLEAGQ